MEIGFVFCVGLVMAFAICIPVGPINILIAQRSMTEGRRAGLAAGLGAAAADAVYGFVAVIGLTIVAPYLAEYRTTFRVVGGLVLILFGLKMAYDAFRTNGRPARKKHESHFRAWASHFGAFLSTMLLTMTNPFTIVAFGATFAALGIADRDLNRLAESSLVLGVFLGSSLWWLTVVMLASAFRNVLSTKWMTLLNRAAGILMMLFGVLVLLSPLFSSPRNGTGARLSPPDVRYSAISP